jgi:hypothetical protein
MTNIEFLKLVIEKLHGGTATHDQSIPVTEVFQGRTVWDGIVEVFHLEGHPKTDKAYAWVHETKEKTRYPVTVLHIHPALSPAAAVRAFIVQEFRNANPAEA